MMFALFETWNESHNQHIYLINCSQSINYNQVVQLTYICIKSLFTVRQADEQDTYIKQDTQKKDEGLTD